MDQEIYPGGSQEQDRMPAGQSSPSTPPPEEDRMPGASKSDLVGRLKSQKWLLFSAFGLVGGVLGTLLAGLTPHIGDPEEPLAWQLVVAHTIWTALAASLLTASLFLANEMYERRRLSPSVFSRGLLVGVVAGAVSGAIAQSVFNLEASFDGVWEIVIQVVCWGIMGGLLGMFLSRAMPNFGMVKGGLGGFIGGSVGGFFFLLVGSAIVKWLPASVSDNMASILAQMVGMGILGATLGFIMVVVEKIFREASLEVVWSPHESSFFNLGAQPIYIGGGRDDEVYVRGLGERHAHVVFAGGAIEYVDAESQKRTPLRNESSIQVGKLKLVVHAAA